MTAEPPIDDREEKPRSNEVGDTLIDLDIMDAEGEIRAMIVFVIDNRGQGRFTTAGPVSIHDMQGAAYVMQQLLAKHLALLQIPVEGHG